MQQLEAEWKHNGQTKKVTTTRNVGESDIEFWERHWTEVYEAQQEFPPDDGTFTVTIGG